MQDTDLYTRLLGIHSPWFIKEVRYTESPERIDVYLEPVSGIEMPCPQCDGFSPVYDHLTEREWQHLHTCHVPTYIHARLPRVKCRQHGVRSVLSEGSEPGSNLTLSFERQLINLEQECSIEGVKRLTGVSWDRCWGVMARAVQRGQRRKKWRVPQYVGVDEKSFAKRHRYETLVCDLETKTIEWISDGRRTESLAEYFLPFETEELAGIKAICMDMWDPYIRATREHVPDAAEKIVFDKFHIMRLLNEAVDKVRRQEHKQLSEEHNELLKGTKHWWLYNPENMPAYLLPRFSALQGLDLKVSRAWAIKENFRHLWGYSRPGWARRFFQRWYFWATHSRLPEVVKAAKTIQRHLDNILTYLAHPITNALNECINGQIEKVKRMACGYRNREHYKTAIYFHCGGLDLYPRANPATTTCGGHPQ